VSGVIRHQLHVMPRCEYSHCVALLPCNQLHYRPGYTGP